MARVPNPGGRAAARLRRLLAVVPYVVRNPGTRIADLAAAFGVDERSLVDDLNLLFVAGLPPYGPGDLIDVQIEEGRVWIGMADYFARPVRLSASEALALYLRGKSLLGTPGLEEAPALASALDKLERTLGTDTLGELAGRVAVEAGAGPGGGVLATLRRAVDGRRRLRMTYYSAIRDEVADREIDPEQLFSAMGRWYVVAWDLGAGDERMFRADRIRSVEETGASFAPRGLAGAGRPLYTPSATDVRVRLRLGPGARWVAEYYEIEQAREVGDGALEVRLPTKDLAWVAKLVLRLAGEVVVLDPAELADLVRGEAAVALSHYGPGPTPGGE